MAPIELSAWRMEAGPNYPIVELAVTSLPRGVGWSTMGASSGSMRFQMVWSIMVKLSDFFAVVKTRHVVFRQRAAVSMVSCRCLTAMMSPPICNITFSPKELCLKCHLVEHHTRHQFPLQHGSFSLFWLKGILEMQKRHVEKRRINTRKQKSTTFKREGRPKKLDAVNNTLKINS